MDNAGSSSMVVDNNKGKARQLPAAEDDVMIAISALDDMRSGAVRNGLDSQKSTCKRLHYFLYNWTKECFDFLFDFFRYHSNSRDTSPNRSSVSRTYWRKPLRHPWLCLQSLRDPDSQFSHSSLRTWKSEFICCESMTVFLIKLDPKIYHYLVRCRDDGIICSVNF